MIADMFRLCSAATFLLTISLAFGDAPTATGNAMTDDNPDFVAGAAYFNRYAETVRSGLESSADPRDWAVDAVMFYFDGKGLNGQTHTATHAARTKLLARAVDAAPDDVLVQWMGIIGARAEQDDATYQKALANLKTIEPENAAVWEEDLSRAGHDRNRAGVSAALTQMAHATTFTNHFAPIADEIIRAYQSVPFPQEEFDRIKRACPECGASRKEDMAFLAATATTAALALPAFQYLTVACRTNPSGLNAERRDDCQKIGRLLASSGDTRIAVRIGSVVLRASRSFDDSDITRDRQNDWIFAESAKALGDGTDPRSLDTARQFQTTWLQNGTELAAMRKAIEHAGLAVEPPADWVDTSASFTPERLRADEERNVPFDY